MSSLKHFRKRSAARVNFKASAQRSKRKALKASGYSLDTVEAPARSTGPRGRGRKATAGSTKDGEATIKPAGTARASKGDGNDGKKESEKRRKKEKRAYSRARGKLSRVSGVLLGRIERRMRGEAGAK